MFINFGNKNKVLDKFDKWIMIIKHSFEIRNEKMMLNKLKCKKLQETVLQKVKFIHMKFFFILL
jgi:hypothetical protein